MRRTRAGLFWCMAGGLIATVSCCARAEASISDARTALFQAIVDSLPRSGTLIAYYECVGMRCGAVVGLDWETGAWFSIARDEVRRRDAQGRVFKASAGEPELAFNDEKQVKAFMIDRFLPFYYLSEIIHCAECWDRVEPLDGGGWEARVCFPMGDRFLVGTDAAAQLASEYDRCDVLTIDANGRLVKRVQESSGVTREYSYSPDSPPNWPVVDLDLSPTGETGWKLVEIEFYPEGRPDLFTAQRVQQIREEFDTAQYEVPVLPEGVRWGLPDNSEEVRFSEQEINEARQRARQMQVFPAVAHWTQSFLRKWGLLAVGIGLVIVAAALKVRRAS